VPAASAAPALVVAPSSGMKIELTEVETPRLTSSRRPNRQNTARFVMPGEEPPATVLVMPTEAPPARPARPAATSIAIAASQPAVEAPAPAPAAVARADYQARPATTHKQNSVQRPSAPPHQASSLVHHEAAGAPSAARQVAHVQPRPIPDDEPIEIVDPSDEAPGLPPAAEPAPAGADDAPPPLDNVQPGQVTPPARPRPAGANGPDKDSPQFEVIDHTRDIEVTLRRSKLLRTKVDIYRTAVVDQRVCNVVQYTPREVSIIGNALGATHVTFWFEDETRRPVTYLVKVVPDPEVSQRRERQYQIFEDIINELFPDSKVHLVPVADKLLVKGEAKDAEEATQILAIIRGNAVYGRGGGLWGGGGGVADGIAAEPLVGQQDASRVPATQVINMLRVPGIQQVMLRVKIAELNRSTARKFAVDLDMRIDGGKLIIQSLLGAMSGSAASIIGHFDSRQINFGIHYLEQEGVIKLLSEPTLVTMSGKPASFVAGGEFAVPTTVGVAGAAAVTNDFRAFGAIITFLPIVIDKDRIRLQVSPEFSKVNSSLSVNNIPGLNTRAVTTTIEMREGQTLAIAGLLEDTMTASLSGNIPFLWRWLGLRNIAREESELIILVTPELVHAMEPEETPPLPGFDVTEPTWFQFFVKGMLEGTPTVENRSTVWPRLHKRYRAGGSSMTSGPFGHGQ
jgi:pilus assembly protein CpaC